MFKNIRNKISKTKTTDEIRSELESDIISLGDVGVECALKSERVPTEMAIDRLDTIRMKGDETNLVFVSKLASRQLDRIMEAKHDR